MLGIEVTVGPGALVPRTSQLVQLLGRRVNTTTSASVVITVDTLPEQLEPTISTSGGRDRFCDPSFWIRCHLLVNPLLQTSLVGRGPTTAAQRLARVVILRVLLNLRHRVIGKVRANNLQSRSRNVLAAKGAHSVVVQTALQNVKVPERPSQVRAIQSGPLGFGPLITGEMLWQFVLLGILDGHARNLVAAPWAITLGRRRRVCADAREDTSRRLVDQTVLIRQVFRKLRPNANLLTLVVALRDRLTDRSISLKLTLHALSIGVRSHLDSKVTVFITLGESTPEKSAGFSHPRTTGRKP